MLFNVSKCKVMHFGRANPAYNYYMSNQKLETSSMEKDLGVTTYHQQRPEAVTTM